MSITIRTAWEEDSDGAYWVAFQDGHDMGPFGYGDTPEAAEEDLHRLLLDLWTSRPRTAEDLDHIHELKAEWGLT